MPEMLTARQLVAELTRRGVGNWGTAIVRRWIHEEPACPVAEWGGPGQSHRYHADAVVTWLRERDQRLGIERPVQPAAAAASDVSPSAGAVRTVGDASAVLAQARDEAEHNETVEQLLAILEGRDPRNWKASEEALMTRMKRLEMLGYMVNVDDMRHCLDAQALVFTAGINALRSQLKLAMADAVYREPREMAIDQEIDLMLERIADAADQALPEGADHEA